MCVKKYKNAEVNIYYIRRQSMRQEGNNGRGRGAAGQSTESTETKEATYHVKQEVQCIQLRMYEYTELMCLTWEVFLAKGVNNKLPPHFYFHRMCTNACGLIK